MKKFNQLAKKKLLDPFSTSPVFGQVQKFFFRIFIASSVFMLERCIKRPFFLEKTTFFSYKSEKLVNQVINEIFRQLTLTLTLELDVPVRPMDAKWLKLFSLA